MRVIAGPCLIESVDHCWRMAEALAKIRERVGVQYFAFKASYRKANRTSIESVEKAVTMIEGLGILDKISREFHITCVTDVHSVTEAFKVPVGIIPQIPALLSRQTDLICAAATSRSIHIKKGQFTSPQDIKWAVEKARKQERDCYVIVSERGYSFGYNNLVVDMRSFPIMKATSGADEVLFDCTHSVQQPSADSGRSGGERAFIEPLARAAIVSGADGLFCEVHDDPSQALSDGPCQIPLNQFEDFLKRMLDLYEWQRANPIPVI